MVPASVSAGVVLVCLTRTQQAALACTVYSVTACLLFGTSAAYHLGADGRGRPACHRRASVLVVRRNTAIQGTDQYLPLNDRRQRDAS
ncbi:hypothetical protein [Streptomyces sp. NPDC057381]|uniref:hypothetical protein n=1 Tax=Streptomyces sp. NPDC057381 TaxID=3346111 RepID=UPI0036411B24